MAKNARQPMTATISPRSRSKITPQAGMGLTPTQEQIRVRAYEIYLRRKGGPGDAHSDWVQAERELRREMSSQY
jgi:hypothetical protein